MTSEPYRYNYDWSGSGSFTTAVVEAIAEATELTVTEFALANYVDPDALNALFRPQLDGTPRADGRVSLSVEGHRIVASADGEILVYPNADREE